ncbi:MAG TPA: trehalose-phosphatase [Firmicutes bacterium]|nr:trehalose-phosphatase [Bacillota bacterium]
MRSSELLDIEVIQDICKKANQADIVFLLLDYDGTLVPFAPTPAEARPDAQLLSLLKRLIDTPGIRVAIVSGRSPEDLRGLISIPGLYLVGGHGSEIIMPDGKTRSLIDKTHIPHIRRKIQEVKELAVTAASGKEGFIFEDKGSSFAIHYRLADPGHAREVIRDFTEKAEKLLAGPHPVKGDLPQAREPHQVDGRAHGVAFELLKGKKLLEVRPVGVNKGEAVRKLIELMGDPGIDPGETAGVDLIEIAGNDTGRLPHGRAGASKARPSRLPIYVGDDTTDEDAFLALKSNGIGVLVSEDARPTNAHYRLRSLDSVRELIGALASVAAGSTAGFLG